MVHTSIEQEDRSAQDRAALEEVAAWAEPSSVDPILAWSRWRRRHQARAKRCHYQRRLTHY